jgi:hypothetical protein
MEDAITPPDLLDKLLSAASDDLVLVGGQALAFWMDRYGVHLPSGVLAVTRDTDFLATSAADRKAVHRLANAIHGDAIFPLPTDLTALVGQAIKIISDTERINVDVIFKVHGANVNTVRASAIPVNKDQICFRVMHPLHVLKSRLDNLYDLQDKQNNSEKSEMQLRCSILIARKFLLDVVSIDLRSDNKRSTALHHINIIETISLSDAGRKVAARHHIHVADAIEPTSVTEKNFFEKKLPQLITLMSEDRKIEVIQEQASKGISLTEVPLRQQEVKKKNFEDIKSFAEKNHFVVVNNLEGCSLGGPILELNNDWILQSAGRDTVRIHEINALGMTNGEKAALVIGALCTVAYGRDGNNHISIEGDELDQENPPRRGFEI